MKTVEQLRQMAISVFEFNGELDYVVAYELDELDYHAELVDNPNDYYLTYDIEGETELVTKSDMEHHILEYSEDIVSEYKKALSQGMNFLIIAWQIKLLIVYLT